MRKLLAVLLAAIMLVGALAVLPASAEANVRTAAFDGTTSDYTPELMITEILINSKSGDKNLDDQMKSDDDVATWISPDAFDYIEIYNAGSTRVNLYDYAVVRSKDNLFFDNNANSENVSATRGQFTHKIKLTESAVPKHEDADGAAFNTKVDFVENPSAADAVLEPGAFAVIWFYGTGTMEYTAKNGTIGLDAFRSHYGTPEDTIVIAVPGIKSNGTSFDLAPNFTYALVKKDFDIKDKVVNKPWSDMASLTDSGAENVICMADYIQRNAVGIFSDANMDDMAAYYVPANCRPDVLNAVNETAATDGETPQIFDDYVQAKFTQTYRSTAILSYVEAPSPGTMPAWQWAYVDPVGAKGTIFGSSYAHGLQSLSEAAEGDDYDAIMKTLVTDWATNTDIKKDGKLDVTVTDGKVAWCTGCIKVLTDQARNTITDNTDKKPEDKIDYTKNFVSRAELEERHKLKEKAKKEEKGMPIWALILIIVGGVVLVAGIAVVVIIIIKKKNRPVAADDVAAEGEVQVVDETQEPEAEAPVDQTEE